MLFIGVHILIERRTFPLIIISFISPSPSSSVFMPLYSSSLILSHSILRPLPLLHHADHPHLSPFHFFTSYILLVFLISLYHFLFFCFFPLAHFYRHLPSPPKWSTADLSAMTSFAADTTPVLHLFTSELLYHTMTLSYYYRQRRERGRKISKQNGRREGSGGMRSALTLILTYCSCQNCIYILSIRHVLLSLSKTPGHVLCYTTSLCNVT